jgi:predicted small lipoprotein YifL
MKSMKSWQQATLEQISSINLSIFKWLITLVLVLTLTSCGEKAGSAELPQTYRNTPAKISQISQKFSEVSPPPVIQELRATLENYRPQVKILSPQPDEVISENTVTVSFQVKDIPIFQDPELQLGPHLHVILDNQPYIAVYDVNKPLILPDLSPGTHTLRVFASRPWHESFKNEGAYAQTTFHIFTKTDDNNPDPTLPVLTYSRPKGNYGAEPILLDFYLTNAPLHLISEDDPNNPISNWRIRCTINGESFILDRWQPIYLQGFKPGNNWIKLEFLDNQGNPLKNSFNTTVRQINYQPKGKDTLAKIVRGELSAEQARSIVDQNYTAKQPTTEATPPPTLETTPEETPKIEIPEAVKPTPEPEATETAKSQEFLPDSSVQTAPLPEIIETPESTAKPEIIPTPKVETPEPPEPETRKSQGFFRNRSVSKPAPLPEIIETPESTAEPEIIPTPEVEAPEPLEAETAKSTETSAPEVTPTDESTPLPVKIAPDPEKPGLKRYFNPRQLKILKPSAQEQPIVPENPPTPEAEQRPGEYKVTTMEP